MAALVRVNTNGVITYNVTEGTESMVITPPQTLDLLQAMESMKTQIVEDTTPSVIITGPDTTFHGIVEFNQDNGSQNATNPHIIGTTLMYRWSDVNPSEGTYDFSKLESDLTTWAGKKIIVRVSASGWKSWKPTNTSWTPDWVYKKGAKSVKTDDGSIKPVYWDPIFLSAYQEFIAAFGQKYDLDERILAVEMGIGDGGETKPDTHNTSDRLKLWKKAGYTDQIWLDTIKKIVGFYKTAFTTSPLIMMPDASFFGGTLHESDVLTVAISEGCWLQENGLIPGEVINPTFQKTTIIMEQRNPTTSPTDLEQDFVTALKNKAAYVLLFSQVIADTSNAQILEKYAAMAK